VAVAAVGGVESDGPAASGSAALAVSLLVVGFGDHGLDTAVAKVSADRAGRVRLIAADRVRSGPRPADVTPHLQLCHQRQEHGWVACLAGRDEGDQGEPVAVDELVDLRGQAAPGAA